MTLLQVFLPVYPYNKDEEIDIILDEIVGAFVCNLVPPPQGNNWKFKYHDYLIMGDYGMTNPDIHLDNSVSHVWLTEELKIYAFKPEEEAIQIPLYGAQLAPSIEIDTYWERLFS